MREKVKAKEREREREENAYLLEDRCPYFSLFGRFLVAKGYRGAEEGEFLKYESGHRMESREFSNMHVREKKRQEREEKEEDTYREPEAHNWDLHS